MSFFETMLSKSGQAALALIVAFVALQAATLDYGTRINDLPFIRDYHVTGNVTTNSSLQRNQVVSDAPDRHEFDRWMVRYKLYSIEADEVVSIIALAHIKPGRLQFNPGFYEYGGAYLYPLGAWYFALSKLGLIHVAPFEQMLKDPQAMDRVWIAGRAFILAAFALSALLLFLALAEIAPAGVALAALAIYLLCPASIMLSQVVKPHWYALLWVNGALLVMVRAFKRDRLPLAGELSLAVCLGLAVGSALTFAVFAILIWGALVTLAARGTIRLTPLVRVPLLALVVFAIANPYYILDWHAVQAERVAAATWFSPAMTPRVLATLIKTSLFAGYGVALIAVGGAVAVWRLIAGPLPARLSAVAILVPVVVVAALTAKLDTWISNFRYLPYELPALLVFLAGWRWPFRATLLPLCAVLTAVQAAPMKLAYFDENSAEHSTRLASAAWIDANIPKADGICLGTDSLSPYEVPPFRFDQYRLDRQNCRWLIRVERNTATVRIPAGFTIAKRFDPRFSPQAFPLVWEHINPQITIYRRHG